jgi:hypothetical protein
VHCLKQRRIAEKAKQRLEHQHQLANLMESGAAKNSTRARASSRCGHGLLRHLG